MMMSLLVKNVDPTPGQRYGSIALGEPDTQVQSFDHTQLNRDPDNTTKFRTPFIIAPERRPSCKLLSQV